MPRPFPSLWDNYHSLKSATKVNNSLFGVSCWGHMRVCQRGWAGWPWARISKTPHFKFYWPGLCRPGSPNPSLLSKGPRLAWPPTHFYRWGLGQPGPPKSLTFIDRAPPAQPLIFMDGAWDLGRPVLLNPHIHRLGLGLAGGPGTSLLCARPSPTPYFYWPDPSLLPTSPGRQLASDPNLSVDRCSVRNP